MKKVAVISLLSLFLFNVMGYFVVFKAEQWQLQGEIQAQIRSGFIKDTDSRVTKITINKSELSSKGITKDNDEITYNDHLYDVAKTTEDQTTITFYCINDTQEESLIANLDNHINTHVANQPVKNPGSKKMTEHVIKVYFSNKTGFDFNTAPSSDNAFSRINLTYLSAQKQAATPPPPEFI